MTLALQLLDNFLLQYNVGQALLLLFVLVMLGTLPLKNKRIVSINAIVFGLIFFLTPSSMAPIEYKLFGVVLLLVGPMLFVTSSR